MLPLLILAMAQEAPASDEIVVVAKRNRCETILKGEKVSDRELARYVEEWRAGVPVRIRMASQADYRCLAKILFKLNDKGVQVLEFVQP